MKLSTTIAVAALALSACASYAPSGIRPGDSGGDVTQKMGSPTARYRLPDGGSRLEYAKGPYGKHTYMIDLDSQGNVARWSQVLNVSNFADVRVGLAQDEVLMKLGTPSDRRAVARPRGDVWSYRYDAGQCQWFEVSVVAGRVSGTGYAPDPLCEAHDGAGA